MKDKQPDDGTYGIDKHGLPHKVINGVWHYYCTEYGEWISDPRIEQVAIIGKPEREPQQPDGLTPCPTCGIVKEKYNVLRSAAELTIAMRNHHADNPPPSISERESVVLAPKVKHVMDILRNHGHAEDSAAMLRLSEIIAHIEGDGSQ
jgi:hypothetical protein